MTFVLFFLFVNQIPLEPLNGFEPNSHERRAWSLARTSLNVKVKGQRSRSPGTKTRCAIPSPSASTEWNALAAQNIMLQHTAPFRQMPGVISAAWVRFVFGKTSLALVLVTFARSV